MRSNYKPLKMEPGNVQVLSEKIKALPEAYLMPVIAPTFSEKHLPSFKEYETEKDKLFKELGTVPQDPEEQREWLKKWDEGLSKTTYGKWLDEEYWKETFDPVDNFWGVFVDGSCVDMVSPKYRIIQHREAFQHVINVIKDKIGADGLEYKLEYTDSAAYLFVTLPQQYSIIEPKTGGLIDIGFVAKNSYDSTHSVEISGFGYRQVCSNGMIARTILGQVKAHHVGAVKDRLEAWVDTFKVRIVDLRERIKMAISVGVTREEATAYFRDLGRGKKFTENALRLWDDQYSRTLDQSMYALYQAAGEVISRQSTNMSDLTGDLEKLEKVLVAPTQVKQHAASLIKVHAEEDRRKAEEKHEKEIRKAYPGAFTAGKQEEPPAAPAEVPEVDLSQADPLPPAKPPAEEPAPEKEKKEKNGKGKGKKGKEGKK